jgi:thiosulfate/3-mercaptopyruvate sulfurtransferase
MEAMIMMMMRYPLSAVLGAGLLFGCGGDTARDESADPGTLTAPTSPAAPLDLFVDEAPPAAQLVFVARERPADMDGRPGAVFVPFSTFSIERDGIPNEFPPADSLAALLEAAGVRGDRVVIVGDPIPAGRAWTAFDYLGLADRAVLLDGGPGALATAPGTAPATAQSTTPAATAPAAARDTGSGTPAPPTGATRAGPDTPVRSDTPGRLDIAVRDDMIVDAAWVHERLDDADVVIIDARPPAEYSGATPGDGITRPGHIPGARNLFWQTLVQSPDEPRLKDEAELRRLFEEAGVRDGVTIVAYCRTGGQSAFLYTVARHLGYDVRLYDGSFVDWSRTDYPVER